MNKTRSFVLALFATLAICATAHAGSHVTGTVKSINIIRSNHSACIFLSTGHTLQVDVNTSLGRAELQLATAAKLSGKRVQAYIAAATERGRRGSLGRPSVRGAWKTAFVRTTLCPASVHSNRSR